MCSERLLTLGEILQREFSDILKHPLVYKPLTPVDRRCVRQPFEYNQGKESRKYQVSNNNQGQSRSRICSASELTAKRYYNHRVKNNLI